MRWLLVGAMGVETAPLLRLLHRPRPRTPRLVVGRHGPLEVGVLTCGVGPDKARTRTAEALQAWSADVVLSLGTCGALVDHLEVGAVLHLDRLQDEHDLLVEVAPLGAPAVGGITVRQGVWDPATRRALAARGAAICEMEAAGVHAAAQGRRLHVLKVVSDRAGGEPDAVAPDRREPDARPSPLVVARFKARALRLVEAHLLPEVQRVLQAAALRGEETR